MSCPECGSPNLTWNGQTWRTLVGYIDLSGHDHDDNCTTRVYICENGHGFKLSRRNRCDIEGCGWVGKLTCFCHDGDKVDEWPEARVAGLELPLNVPVTKHQKIAVGEIFVDCYDCTETKPNPRLLMVGQQKTFTPEELGLSAEGVVPSGRLIVRSIDHERGVVVLDAEPDVPASQSDRRWADLTEDR